MKKISFLLLILTFHISFLNSKDPQDFANPEYWARLYKNLETQKTEKNADKIALSARGIQYVLGAKNANFQLRMKYFYLFLAILLEAIKNDVFRKTTFGIKVNNTIFEKDKIILNGLSQTFSDEIKKERDDKMKYFYSLISNDLNNLNSPNKLDELIKKYKKLGEK